MNDDIDTKKEIRVRTTPSFKLKDQVGRIWQAINMKKQFGFLPETIIIEKVHGQNNRIFVRAVLTPEEIEKEDKIRSEQAKTEVVPENKPV